MVDLKDTPDLQPKDFFTEEITEHFYYEASEVIFLDFSSQAKSVEKKKRLSKE